MEKELKSLFQLWSKKIDNRDVDSIDCGIAFEDRVYFEDKINDNLNCLNLATLEVGPIESEKQELKLVIKELEQLKIELVENFEIYNNRLIERPHQNIFDESDSSVEETGDDNSSESFFDDLSDFSDNETDDDDYEEFIYNHRYVLHNRNREINEVNV